MRRKGADEGMGTGARPTAGGGRALLRLLGYLKGYRGRVAAVVAFTVLGTVFQVVAPALTGDITTELFEGATGGGFDWRAINRLLVLLASAYLAGSLFQFLQGFIMNRVAAQVLQGLRDEVDRKLGRLKLSYYDGRPNGEVLSVVTNDIDTLSQALSQSFSQLVAQAATAVGILVMMLSISPALTLVAVAMVPLSFAASGGVMRRSRRHFRDQQDRLARLNGYIEELYEGQGVVQSFNCQERAIGRFDELNGELRESARLAGFNSGAIRPIASLFTNLGYAASALLGCLFAMGGGFPVGGIQSMLQYTRQFSQPFTQIAAMAGQLGGAAAAAGRVFSLLDEEEEAPDPADAAVPAEHDGRVAFEHVRFGYEPGAELMHDVCFEARPGQKVAIVGPTGAGKTTLVNLLMRFYETDGGLIAVDGVDARRMSRHELRSRFGMVLQDTWLFEGSIRDNIAYSADDPAEMSDERVEAAARAACADSFIRAYPGGYRMRLEHGADNVSQGERQLITIARAIAADPEVMILDEATSSVDARTEAAIQRAMANLMRGRTSFVIAHRLSTIRDADLVLYMEHGDILEAGTHEELLARNGRYAALYRSQFE